MTTINLLLDEWRDYCERNWITPSRKMFDPEDKVKFFLGGLANIILRPNMDGVLTDYQKMKIGKYEIPFTSCSSETNDEIFSNRPVVDNGEEKARMTAMLENLAEAYDAAREAKHKTEPKKPKKPRQPTRREKIEAARKDFGIVDFEFVYVRANNEFYYRGHEYLISEEADQYAPHYTKDGEVIFDMDHILCGVDGDGHVHFFDMNIKNISDLVKKID